MKNSWVLWVTAAGCLILGSACSFAPRHSSENDQYIVIDSSSRNVLDAYEYGSDTGNLLKTTTYDGNGRIRRATEYAYGSDGNLSSRTVKIPQGGRLLTSVTSYDVKKEYDAQNRLVKTVQTADSGETVETYYGYDENGTLRGVVQKTGDAIMMMDY